MSKDAKPDTWMPLVIGDYLKDTTRLTTEQHGAYLLLIMSYWVDGPPLNDDEELASITGLERKAWMKHRPKLERFFRIEGGHWRHKRVDEELERWSRKKEIYAARAAAGGRAKAAKSSPQAQLKQPKSTKKSCLKAAPQPASTEVEGLTDHSTLCSENRFAVPEGVRDAFLAVRDEGWVVSYIDRCGWQEVPRLALIAPNSIALGEVENALRQLKRKNISEIDGLSVVQLERAA